MPCDTVSLIGVKLDVANPQLLIKALKELGHNPIEYGGVIQWGQESYNTETKELRVRSADTVATIKQAYSAEIVKHQAKKYGWQIKVNPKNKFQFQVIKNA